MQDTNVPQNRVIIVGGDHHNGLGLARIFGLNGKKITAIVVSNKKRSWMATSKFIECSKIFRTEKEAFDYILESFSSQPQKAVLIPYSDRAALELDSRLNEFKENFIVPSINNEEGRIAAMMDKKAQYTWAEQHGVKMAKTVIFNVNEDLSQITSSIDFPIILKPVVSAQGSKFDIRICNSRSELKQSIELLKQKKYELILVQQYLAKRSEMLIVGAIADNYTFSVHEVIRRWPEPGGCGSFSQLVADEEVLKKCSRLLKEISNYGYKGLIDVETFFVDGEVYLNEINWRNSGGSFRAINGGFYYAFWWYMHVLTSTPLPKWNPYRKSYSMVEYADFRHVFKRNISLIQWIKDVRKTQNFSVFCKSDIKPFFSKILYTLI